MEKYLKSCPFCGGKDYEINSHGNQYAVRCMTKYCWSFGPPRFNEKEAIEIWNTRAKENLTIKNAEMVSTKNNKTFRVRLYTKEEAKEQFGQKKVTVEEITKIIEGIAMISHIENHRFPTPEEFSKEIIDYLERE